MFFLGNVCEISAVLKVIYFVSELLNIVFVVVPIGLIVMMSVDFMKNVIAGKEEDMKKNFNLAIKRVIMTVGLFLVPTIVEFVVLLLGDIGVPYTDCLTNATLDKIAVYEQKEIAEKEEKEKNETGDDDGKNVVNLGGNSSGVSVVGKGGSSDEVKMYTSDKIKLNETIKYLMYEDSFKLKVTSSDVDVSSVKWSTSDKDIVTVDSKGNVEAVGAGLAVVTAKVGSESVSCKVIAIRNTLKVMSGVYRTKATVYYDGDKKLTYYFRRQGYGTACSSETLNGEDICTAGFKQWYQGHGCGTTSVTAVVNAYLGNEEDELISVAKMRMYYEKKEYDWSCSVADPYCNSKCNQFTRQRVADVLTNQFDLKATPYVIESNTGNEEHIERITNALAQGRPVIIFVNAKDAGTTKFTSQVHTLTMVSFADAEGHVLVLDSSHNGFKEDTVEKMVNYYIGRGKGIYKGYIVLEETKK